MKTLTLKVPEDLAEELDRVAAQRGATKSTLVRRAIREHLDRGTEASRGSFLEAASDLAGAVEGPADLSTHSKHLRGYGR
ncbi:MAG TPA: ribbon-helix-helix domain-containing protein [Thermoanaerobaculia bacterium]|jgi:predicted transcriptional regulator|nr:ribbon-helix-helix domain-containing protein [Thermoanaerobaculia bacterium]